MSNFFESLGSLGGSDSFKSISESVLGDNIANDTLTALFGAGAESSTKKEEEALRAKIAREQETARLNELSMMSGIQVQAHIEQNKSVYAIVAGVVVVVVLYFFMKKK